MSDRIARTFNRSGASRAVALDISKVFNRVCHTGLLHKLKSYGISGQIFGLISSFVSNRQRWVVLDGKYSQEYPVNAGVPQGYIFGPTFFLLYINDPCDDVICDIAIYADDTTLYSKCDEASDLTSASCQIFSEIDRKLITNRQQVENSLKIDVTKKLISQELKHILPSCKKHWKACLILL